jgi:hypothetical protein
MASATREAASTKRMKHEVSGISIKNPPIFRRTAASGKDRHPAEISGTSSPESAPLSATPGGVLAHPKYSAWEECGWRPARPITEELTCCVPVGTCLVNPGSIPPIRQDSWAETFHRPGAMSSFHPFPFPIADLHPIHPPARPRPMEEGSKRCSGGVELPALTSRPCQRDRPMWWHSPTKESTRPLLATPVPCFPMPYFPASLSDPSLA